VGRKRSWVRPYGRPDTQLEKDLAWWAGVLADADQRGDQTTMKAAFEMIMLHVRDRMRISTCGIGIISDG